MTRDQFLSVPDVPAAEPLAVPEWGGGVHVRPLGLDEIAAAYKAAGGDHAAQLDQFALYGLSDADGNRLLGPDDLPALKRKPVMGRVRVGKRVVELTRLGETEADAGNG